MVLPLYKICDSSGFSALFHAMLSWKMITLPSQRNPGWLVAQRNKAANPTFLYSASSGSLNTRYVTDRAGPSS